jgi:DNA mismatch repair protein MutS
VARSLATRVRAFTLFATHYFELTTLAQEIPGVVNLHLDATEHGEELVFLHAVREGPASRSRGLPWRDWRACWDVIEAARAYLVRLEANATRRRGCITQTELPRSRRRTALAARAPDSLLAALSPDELAPRDALQLLYELHRAALESVRK